MKCPHCKKEWDSIEDFLQDLNLEYIGEAEGLLYFNHTPFYCGTTLVIGRYFSDADAKVPLSFEDRLNKRIKFLEV